MLKAVLVYSALLAAVALSSDCDSSSRRLTNTSKAQPIVLDDLEANGTRWHSGEYRPCIEDAFNGMYHHDRARDKGLVSAEYKFDPPKDGCYVVEEHHPGNNPQCAKYLPTNARVDVDFWKGKSTYTYVDQSQGGGQWNILGALPFFVGWEGKIKVTNNGTSSTCWIGGGCVWVADAFRVTWVSDLANGCGSWKWTGVEVPTGMPAMPTTLADVPATTTPAAPATTGDVPGILQQVARTQASILDPVQVHDAYQTVVDDASISTVAPWVQYASRRGSLKCGFRGWLQTFLYLDPSSGENADAAIQFPFDPPADGCYLVEEFHPDNKCNQAFSSQVGVSVDYCKGLTKLFQVDQTQNGNRWNTVGLLPFYKGHPGNVKVSHPQIDSALAIADAFRFTRVSESCQAAQMKAVQFVRLEQNAASMVIDNRKSLATPESKLCGKKALGGSLRAVSGGEAEARFEFEPSSTGCYRIDSYHPENEKDEGCLLADSAAVEINWCLGKQTVMMAPLKGKGNRWNTIGHFKYYAGTKGTIVSRPVGALHGKHWVSDAFRFTKVAESCTTIPDVGLLTLHISGPNLDGLNASILDSGLTSYPDMRIALHEAILEATKLSHDAVNLLSLRKGSIIVDVEVKGTRSVVEAALSSIRSQISNQGSTVLQKSLCNAVLSDPNAACEVTVMLSELLPAPDGTDEEASKSTESSSYTIYVIVGASTFLCSSILLCLLCFMRHLTRSKSQQCEDPVTTSPRTNVDAGPEVVANAKIACIEEFTEKPKNDEEISLSGSTATPTSSHHSQVDLEIASVGEQEQGAVLSAVASTSTEDTSPELV